MTAKRGWHACPPAGLAEASRLRAEPLPSWGQVWAFFCQLPSLAGEFRGLVCGWEAESTGREPLRAGARCVEVGAVNSSIHPPGRGSTPQGMLG